MCFIQIMAVHNGTDSDLFALSDDGRVFVRDVIASNPITDVDLWDWVELPPCTSSTKDAFIQQAADMTAVAQQERESRPARSVLRGRSGRVGSPCVCGHRKDVHTPHGDHDSCDVTGCPCMEFIPAGTDSDADRGR